MQSVEETFSWRRHFYRYCRELPPPQTFLNLLMIFHSISLRHGGGITLALSRLRWTNISQDVGRHMPRVYGPRNVWTMSSRVIGSELNNNIACIKNCTHYKKELESIYWMMTQFNSSIIVIAPYTWINENLCTKKKNDDSASGNYWRLVKLRWKKLRVNISNVVSIYMRNFML